jgi:hypothetical protein
MSLGQHQFCTSGYIAATGEALLACSYENVDNLNDYELIPLGSSRLNGDWVRVPPNGRVRTDTGQFIIGASTIEPEYVTGTNIYFTRTSSCAYMKGCYNHDAGWDYEFCQEYWNTEVDCKVKTTFYQGINPSIWLYIGVALAIIVVIIAITAMFIASNSTE